MLKTREWIEADGLDNIGVFDHSAPLPTGGFIHQADGTAWMAMYSLNLMCIALELAHHKHTCEDIATKFFWMPVFNLLIESLRKFHHYYGDDFKVECPAGSGQA
jgi:hypothetical protein